MHVRWFRKPWFVVAALAWLPAVAHCPLESLTGFEFLQCAEESPASQPPSGDCHDCCAVEKSQFRAEQSRPLVLPPDCLSSCQTPLLIPEASPAVPAALDLTAAPPDLSPRWHFLARTALPVRAPSLVA
jgi:hypothetical protein